MGIFKSKLFIIFLIAGLISVLAACTTTGNDGNGINTEDTTNIRFMIWHGEGDVEIWEQVIADFEQEFPHITVDFEPSSFNEYWTRLQTQLASNSAADVIGMHVGIIFEYADKGQLASLDNFLKQSTSDISGIPESLIEEGAWPVENSIQYALPWRFVAGALYANKDAFEDAGVSFPVNGWTIEEFRDTAKKLSTDGRYGLKMPEFTMSTSLLSSFGGSPLSGDRLNSNFNSPEVLDFYQWTHELLYQDKSIMHPEDVDDSIDPFISQQVAMTYGGSWMIPVYRGIEDFEWDILPNPTLNGNSATYSGPDMISITEDSDKKEAAWKFVEYAVFHEKAQELLGSTGLPIQTEALLDEERIESISQQGPANYKVMIDGAIERGSGYAFNAKFFEISGFVSDAGYLMYESENSDIEKILNDLHQQVNAEMQR